jgi:hypothetical protein
MILSELRRLGVEVERANTVTSHCLLPNFHPVLSCVCSSAAIECEVSTRRTVLTESSGIGRTAQFTPVLPSQVAGNWLLDVAIAGHDGKRILAARATCRKARTGFGPPVRSHDAQANFLGDPRPLLHLVA